MSRLARPARPEPAAAPGPVSRLAALALLALAAGPALALQVTPLAAIPGGWKPDLVYALLAAFVLRRPAAAPLWLVALLLISRDALSAGPPGAAALTELIALEALRARALARPVPAPLWSDALAAAVAYSAALLAQWLLMVLTLAPVPSLAALGPALLATALAIPLAALLPRLLPRERRA